ncbi:MAG TPA: acylphosphatase [Steroidobacteraceae bacterium]|jgi:acylphosphatase|nr:acylphosphatase [Steroidobacteraceae bacterium]
MNDLTPDGQRIARRCYVSGRVQGVNYRASARRQALAAGITGYARNLPDGRVEVFACGAGHAVQALIEWLWVGPSAARVTSVVVEELATQGTHCPSEFTTG